MSHQERELMKLMDEHILNATEKELVKLQKADVDTQLDGIWFYDTCNASDQMEQKQSIRNSKAFSKQTR